MATVAPYRRRKDISLKTSCGRKYEYVPLAWGYVRFARGSRTTRIERSLQKSGFSMGSNVLAVQFHAEISENQLCGCFEDFTEDLKSLGDVNAKLEELRRDTAAYAATLEKQNALFLREWLEGLSHA